MEEEIIKSKLNNLVRNALISSIREDYKQKYYNFIFEQLEEQVNKIMPCGSDKLSVITLSILNYDTIKIINEILSKIRNNKKCDIDIENDLEYVSNGDGTDTLSFYVHGDDFKPKGAADILAEWFKTPSMLICKHKGKPYLYTVDGEPIIYAVIPEQELDDFIFELAKEVIGMEMIGLNEEFASLIDRDELVKKYAKLQKGELLSKPNARIGKTYIFKFSFDDFKLCSILDNES